MDLEQLTKHQIILLTLLVSFVTSIATGIVTVTLMNQAPPSVTRTINQIVERTVETVSPASAPAAVATTQTVVVKDDDLATQSIATAQKSVIRIVAKGDDTLIARGVIIAQGGAALTDGQALKASGASDFEAILPGGERVALIVPTGQSTSTPIELVNLAVGTTTGWAPASLADDSKLSLGSSIIRLGGVGGDSVSEGVISSLPNPKGDTIEASAESSTPGSLIMTLFGDVIGISTLDSQAKGEDFYTILPALSGTSATSTAS